MALLIASFLGSWASQSTLFDDMLPLRSGSLGQQPWTLVTYPFFQASQFVWFLVLLFWLFSIGGSVESELGTTKFVGFWVVMTVLGGLLFMLGCSFTRSGALFGSLIPVSAVTVFWCTRNPRSEVRLFGLIPIMGVYLGWITAGVVLFDVGRIHPMIGALCALTCVVSYLYAAQRIQGLSSSKKAQKAGPRGRFYSDEYYEDAQRRTKEREDRERLKKLLGDD